MAVVALTLGAPRSTGDVAKNVAESAALAPGKLELLGAGHDGHRYLAAFLANRLRSIVDRQRFELGIGWEGDGVLGAAARTNGEAECGVGRAEAGANGHRGFVDGQRLTGHALRSDEFDGRLLAGPWAPLGNVRTPAGHWAAYGQNGIPEKVACQMGPTSALHTSAHASDFGRRELDAAISVRAPSAIRHLGRYLRPHVDERSLPPSTRTSALVTLSPGQAAEPRAPRPFQQESCEDDVRVDLPVEAYVERALHPHERRQGAWFERRPRPPVFRSNTRQLQIIVGEAVFVEPCDGPPRARHLDAVRLQMKRERDGFAVRQRPFQCDLMTACGQLDPEHSFHPDESLGRLPVEQDFGWRPLSGRAGKRHRGGCARVNLHACAKNSAAHFDAHAAARGARRRAIGLACVRRSAKLLQCHRLVGRSSRGKPSSA